MKKILRQTAYHSRLLHRHHRKRNKNTLTVVLFHRVLPKDSPEWEGADPEWTVTTDFFEECLHFFRKHYSVVGFPEVLENYQGGAALPDNPLLITFDDGWRCNLQHAAPLLEKLGFPAILFVATGATGKPILSWQEALFALWKSNKLDTQKTDAIAELAKITPPGPIVTEAEYHKFLAILRDRPLGTRNRLNAPLFDWISTLPGLPYMLNRKELLEWQKRGFHLGTHGTSHEPMVDMEGSHQELHLSKHVLANIVGNGQTIRCFSPPHGIYNEELLETAAKIGYLCACTSRKGLNHTRERSGFIDLGRININQLALMNTRKKLDPSKLASLLFLQPILEQ
ncbi:polysaccharide deacetylase family protein [Thiolapillus sp.]